MSTRLLIAVISVLFAGAAQAAVQANPFVNIAGTGTVTGHWPWAWTDRNVNGSDYLEVGGAFLTREERWDQPQTIGSFIFESTNRGFGGEIWVATAPGGEFTTKLTTFTTVSEFRPILVNAPATGVYGVKVIVNDPCGTTYYQVGEMEILAKPLGANLALGMSTVNGGGGAYGNGSVTDLDYFTEWRASETATENWVGFEVPDGGSIKVSGIRVSSTSRHGTTWSWLDYDVQVKQDGQWGPALLRASVPAGTGLNWIDFGAPLTVQGIRLYGSDAGGNNPTANNGKIVDDIFAFLLKVPGDANNDAKVDFADYLILESSYGSGPTAENADADFDDNGVVEFADYLVLEANFGTGAVPEPTTLLVLLAGGWLIKRR